MKVTATITYKTKTYSIDYTVYVSALDGKLDEVVNGSSLNFDLGDLEKLAENAVYKVDKTNVTIKSVRILTLPTSSDGVVIATLVCPARFLFLIPLAPATSFTSTRLTASSVLLL